MSSARSIPAVSRGSNYRRAFAADAGKPASPANETHNQGLDVLRVCENCREWMEEIVISDEPAVICPHCGHLRPFLRLPLFQVAGASGSGKSRVSRDLPSALPECVVLDQDVLLSGLPWEQHRRNWLRVAMNIHQGGSSTVLIATQLPEHYESLPERAWFSEIHYLALVCDSEQIADRLLRRPSWRQVTDEVIARMQKFNDWLKANGQTTCPPMTLLDTSNTDPVQSVSAVAAWVRERLAI